MENLSPPFLARHRPPVWFASAVVALAAVLLAGCSRDRVAASLPVRPAAVSRFPAGLAVALTAAEARVQHAPDDQAAWLKLGQLYHANGFQNEAAQCYRTVVAHSGGEAHAYYLLADIGASAGDLEALESHLEHALRLAPEYAPAHLLLAEARYKSGSPAAAVAGYEAALRFAPMSMSARVGLARERMRVGDDDGAAAMLEELIALDPKHSTGLSLLARIVEERGDAARAASLREQARARKDPPPDDRWMDEMMRSCYDVQRLGMRFEDYVKSGRQDDAWACLKQLEAVDPANWIVCRIRGMAAEMQGHPADAVREYERALAAGGDPAKLFPPLIGALVSLQRHADAETRAREGLRLLPGAAALLAPLADLRIRQGDRAEARALLTQALSREPDNAAANLAMARLFWESGDRASAAAHLESVRRAAPADIRARALLGQYHLDRGEPEQAVAPLAEAHRLEPSNAAIGDMLALAHLRSGNRAAKAGQAEQALLSYDEALAIRPEMPEIFANKVQVLLRLEQFAPAADAMQRLATLRPANPAIFLSLGDIQNSAGQAVAAKASWQKALQLLGDQGDPDMRAALAARLEAVETR